MKPNSFSLSRLFSPFTLLTLVVMSLVLFYPIQHAEAKEKEEKVKEVLKFSANLSVNWTIDNENSKNTGSMTIRAQGPLILNREMSSMDQGLPAVMVNYKSQGNTLGFYSYKETIIDKNPPEDCPNQVVEKYEAGGSALLKIVPGPGNLITNHFASLFKDTGLGHMTPPDVSGMLIDHYILALPFNEIEINGQKLDQGNCSWKPSTRKIKIANSIIGKIGEKGKMEGSHTWSAKVDSTSSPPYISVKVNELPKTMNNEKPYAPEKTSDGNVTYTLSWNIEEFKPQVLIYRLKDNDWHDVTDATPDDEEQQIYPGERLVLRAIVVMPGETGEPPEGRWEITDEDKILKEWEARESGSNKVEVTEFDKREIDFFWWKETRSAKVKYVVQSKGLNGKTEFKLVMPKVTVAVDPGSQILPEQQKSECALVPYSPTAQAGMKVTSTVTTEKNKPLCLEYIQLIKEDNWSLRADYTKRSFFWHKKVHGFMLDTSYPYNGEACGASGSVTKQMLDSPNTQGPRKVASIYWDQQFQIFLMFRPGKAGDNNAWVPLKRMEWGWKLNALNVNNPFGQEEICTTRFDLSNPANKSPKDGDVSPKQAQDYPQWSETSIGDELDLTDIEVENTGDNYKSRPPR
jgi:hypothetical protein